MHSCCTDYARNLNGKRPVRSRNRNCMMYSPTDFTDFTTIRFLCHADFADFSYPILLLNQMKNNLRHPIDRTGLNLCKSVKSVGQKNNQKKSASSAKSA